MKPKIVTSVFVRVYQNKLGRFIVKTFGTTVLSVTGCPVRPDNMDNVILSATTMVYSRFKQVRPVALLIAVCYGGEQVHHLFHWMDGNAVVLCE